MISVVIPTRNSSIDLPECIKSLKSQTKKPKEIVVVFDSKEDKNIQFSRSVGVKIVFDGGHTIGSAYYAGAKAAIGDIVAFVDDDCIIPKGWVNDVEKEFKEDIDVFGGEDLLPEKSTFFQRSAYQIDKSRILREPVYGKDAKSRLRAANIAYRKKIFKNDNFDSKLRGLQEPEFHHRIFKKGYKMKFNPNIFVYHKRRQNITGIFNQIHRNGKAKVDILKIHPDMKAFYDYLIQLYALFFVATIAFGIVTSMKVLALEILEALIAVLAVYFLAKTLFYITKTHEIKYYPVLLVIVIVREMAYSLGFLQRKIGL